MSPIRYRAFWDVPRIFLTADATGHYLFDCSFDEQLDDYPPFYDVYLMPALNEDLLSRSWSDLPRRALRRLGRASVSDVVFDASRRKEVDLDRILESLQQ